MTTNFDGRGYVSPTPVAFRTTQGAGPIDTQALQTNETNLREFSLACADTKYGFIRRDDDVTIAHAGVAPLNRALSAQFDGSIADRRIADVLNTVMGRGRILTWIVSPLNKPDDLGVHLTTSGFEVGGHWTCMGVDFNELAPEVAIPRDVTIEEVTDVNRSREWCLAVCTGFGIPRSIHGAIHDVFAEATFREDSPLRHFVAYLHGIPVAGATVFNGSETAGVYFVSTVPKARGRRIGPAVTHHALLQSREWGHKSAILQASELGRPVYHKLGFAEQGPMEVYRYSFE